MQALIIDDSRTMRMILSRMMAELGLDVLEAANGRAALDALGSGNNPELMLVDWNMPVMSGIDFIRVVREPPYSSTALILMVTTESELPGVVTALESGADEYLMKPFTKDSIVEKLQLLGLDL